MEPFRLATLADLPEIVAIYNSTIASRLVTADTEPVSVESKKDWFFAHDSERRPLWVMEEDQDILGWISFQSFYGRPAYDGTAEISIYLAESARGKGLGKKALAFGLAKAPSCGIKTVLGFIFAHNVPSLQLFKQAGFDQWANLPNIAKMDEQEYSLCILGKRVEA